MTDLRSLLHRLADARALAFEDMPDDLAADVRAALSDSTPSPAPTDSGAEPARGEGASARACWDCRHAATPADCSRDWTEEIGAWIRVNCPGSAAPSTTARNCPGWAPREAGEVSDGS